MCSRAESSALISFWGGQEAEGLGGFAELVEIGRAAGIVQQEALAQTRIIEHVERHRLATHQIDEILTKRIAQQMRDPGCREAHEIAGPDLIGLAVDIDE